MSQWYNRYHIDVARAVARQLSDEGSAYNRGVMMLPVGGLRTAPSEADARSEINSRSATAGGFAIISCLSVKFLLRLLHAGSRSGPPRTRPAA